MSDPDRLAAIKAELTPEELDWIERHYRGIKDPVLWLISEVERLTRERDLAVAHDRQPYPTAQAYERVCAALERQRGEVERLRGLLGRLEWTGCYREESACPVCQVYGTGDPQENEGHLPVCWLADELGPAQPGGPAVMEVLSRHVPGHYWVRVGVTLSRGFEPGHNWQYSGLVHRDAWRLGRLGMYLLRMPNSEARRPEAIR